MPDTTDIEKARALVGTYCRSGGTVYRITNVDEDGQFSLFAIYHDAGRGVMAATFPGWMAKENGEGPGSTVPISRAEYLAVAGPLYAELGKLAGITVDCPKE
jgi:hypothetical protein